MNFNRHSDDPLQPYVPDKPHFFKVVLAAAIKERKLGLPIEFFRRYGVNLSDQVTLKVPPDAAWKIEITKSDGVLWLQNGFKNFIDHYKLDHGYFLSCTCEDNSNISVIIYDTTGAEICYPYGIVEEDKESETKKTEDSRVNLNLSNSDQLYDSYSKRRKPRWSNSRPHKVTRTNSMTKLDKDHSAQKVEVKDEPTILQSIKDKIQKKKLFTGEEKALCLKMAGDFKSDHPFFVVVIQPSSLVSKGVMTVPASFVRAHANKKKDYITILNHEQKTWKSSYYGGTSSTTPSGRMHSGWLKFAQDNKLGVGDVCAFEKLKPDELFLRVSIFKFLDYCYRLLPPGDVDGCQTEKEKIVSTMEAEKGKAIITECDRPREDKATKIEPEQGIDKSKIEYGGRVMIHHKSKSA